MINEKGMKQNRKMKIDFSWPFQSSFGYYIEQNNYPYVEIIKNKDNREALNINADYYIYLNKSLEKVGYDSYNQKILSIAKDTTLQIKDESIIIYTNLQ